MFQKSVLTGTGEALAPPVTFMREYQRLISSKNMPVCVCMCVNASLLRAHPSVTSINASAVLCVDHNHVPKDHMARPPSAVTHAVKNSPLVTINSSA